MVCDRWAFEKWPKYGQILIETCIRDPLLILIFTWPGCVPGVDDLVGVKVHTSANTASRVALLGKLSDCFTQNRDLKFHFTKLLACGWGNSLDGWS